MPSSVGPTNGGVRGDNNSLSDDATIRMVLENGAMDRLMHPNLDAGFMSGDENTAWLRPERHFISDSLLICLCLTYFILGL